MSHSVHCSIAPRKVYTELKPYSAILCAVHPLLSVTLESVDLTHRGFQTCSWRTHIALPRCNWNHLPVASERLSEAQKCCVQPLQTSEHLWTQPEGSSCYIQRSSEGPNLQIWLSMGFGIHSCSEPPQMLRVNLFVYWQVNHTKFKGTSFWVCLLANGQKASLSI